MKNKLQLLKLNKEEVTICLFLIPSLCGFLIFYLLPFMGGIYYTLVDINGKFVGLENFISLLTNSMFFKALSNTIIFIGICVPCNMIFSLSLAMLLNKVTYHKEIFRMCFVSPLVVPVASVAFFWQIVFDFNGSLNSILDFFHIESIDWINTSWIRIVVVIIYLWKNMGYSIILYLAGLNHIPKTYYEAAEMDGANEMQILFNITLIYLMPTNFFVFIISIINSFKTFREVYLISGEYPHESVYMIQHYMNNMFAFVNYQKLTTAAYILAFIITLLIGIFFIFEKKISDDFIQ